MIHRIDGREAWEQVSREVQGLERQVGTNPKGCMCPTEGLRLDYGLKGACIERCDKEARAGWPVHQKVHSGDSGRWLEKGRVSRKPRRVSLVLLSHVTEGQMERNGCTWAVKWRGVSGDWLDVGWGKTGSQGWAPDSWLPQYSEGATWEVGRLFPGMTRVKVQAWDMGALDPGKSSAHGKKGVGSRDF